MYWNTSNEQIVAKVPVYVFFHTPYVLLNQWLQYEYARNLTVQYSSTVPEYLHDDSMEIHGGNSLLLAPRDAIVTVGTLLSCKARQKTKQDIL